MTEIRAAAPSGALQRLFEQQAARNHQLLKQTPTLGGEIRSEVLPFAVDLKAPALPDDAERALAALEKVITVVDEKGRKVHGVAYTQEQARQPGWTLVF